jgi:hypothetical protein
VARIFFSFASWPNFITHRKHLELKKRVLTPFHRGSTANRGYKSVENDNFVASLVRRDLHYLQILVYTSNGNLVLAGYFQLSRFVCARSWKATFRNLQTAARSWWIAAIAFDAVGSFQKQRIARARGALKVTPLDFEKRLSGSTTPGLTERATWSEPGRRL